MNRFWGSETLFLRFFGIFWFRPEQKSGAKSGYHFLGPDFMIRAVSDPSDPLARRGTFDPKKWFLRDPPKMAIFDPFLTPFLDPPKKGHFLTPFLTPF